jgi:hypothetical protein
MAFENYVDAQVSVENSGTEQVGVALELGRRRHPASPTISSSVDKVYYNPAVNRDRVIAQT